MNQEQRRLYLIKALLSERVEYAGIIIPDKIEQQRVLLRALVNVRTPETVSAEFLDIQNAYLQEELTQKTVTKLTDLTPISGQLYLWKGDITTLKVDGIVNAANSQLLGCFYPNHKCIDNAIHTFAGVQLRQECHRLMKEQVHLEKTGEAKITPAYNLPSKYVLHTVGPIVDGRLLSNHEKDLISSYRSCLELAEANGLKSLAFCCISTGEFHFPQERATELAVTTVQEYLKETDSKMEVIFNVFKEDDERIYKRLLGAN